MSGFLGKFTYGRTDGRTDGQTLLLWTPPVSGGPNIRKILWAVPEKSGFVRTDVRTDGRTYGTDFIGPFSAKAEGPINYRNYSFFNWALNK